MRKKAKFTYSQPGKAIEKQIERIDYQETKQAEVLKYLKPAIQRATWSNFNPKLAI